MLAGGLARRDHAHMASDRSSAGFAVVLELVALCLDEESSLTSSRNFTLTEIPR
jgi:hypothetical protein